MMLISRRLWKIAVRYYSPNCRSRVQRLLDAYSQLKANPVLPRSISVTSDEIFANNQVCLGEIDAVGFDYDYTLCHYKPELQQLIYVMARDFLVNKFRYPSNLVYACIYDPKFAIRGLTLDIEKGLLCKMSSLKKVSDFGVFRGHQRLSPSEILQEYDGTPHISASYLKENMTPLNDLFGLSEACLFADVMQFFIESKIPYESRLIAEDIDKAIAFVHHSGLMHEEVTKDLAKYIEPSPLLLYMLQELKASGKELFLCSNSTHSYINAGMTHMLGENWTNLFDVVIVNARKPDFFTRKRTFRYFDTDKHQVKWDAVNTLDRNSVYTQGSLHHLNRLKPWKSRRVLYIGDSLFSDLVEPNRIQGWRTGAVIRELDEEIEIQSSTTYQSLLLQIEALEELLRRIQIEMAQKVDDNEECEIMKQLVQEHKDLHRQLDAMLNVNFGSVFRTGSHPSLFAFCVQRYVDLYSSRVENFLEYSSDFTFYPQHVRLPHEPKLSINNNIYDNATKPKEKEN